MYQPDFWNNSEKAQELIKELQELKDAEDGAGKYDRNGTVMTIFAGAGGADAEDFAGMLFTMYRKFFEKKNWEVGLLHRNQNDHGGFRNITVEIHKKGSYGILKNESGVHRLVRLSPFNAKSQRHTSFAMVEMVPMLDKNSGVEINEDDLHIDYTRSSGPGGQNVNKRETAVRIVHTPTKLSAFVDSQRSQLQNKEKAMDILRAKLYNRQEEERKAQEDGLAISKTTEVEWGNQIRSYVLHPYKMVKDHRNDLEIRNAESVLDGNIEPFIEAFNSQKK
jgi:peptide chain release factor 2